MTTNSGDGARSCRITTTGPQRKMSSYFDLSKLTDELTEQAGQQFPRRRTLGFPTPLKRTFSEDDLTEERATSSRRRRGASSGRARARAGRLMKGRSATRSGRFSRTRRRRSRRRDDLLFLRLVRGFEGPTPSASVA